MYAWDYRPLDSPVLRAQGREATLEEALRACRLHARQPLVWREESWGVWTAASPDGTGRYAVYPLAVPVEQGDRSPPFADHRPSRRMVTRPAGSRARKARGA